MAAQNPAATTDLFDLYFRRADLNQDGKISGAEAVAFFQGASLPKQVLAQIWDHADQNRTGFLGRADFYNALKLVTVAQSKRELTPDIVKAALFGPAAAKIPAPKIDLAATPGPSLTSAAPPSQMGSAGPTAHQNTGFRGPQVPQNTSMSQQYFPSQGNQYMRPPQSMASGGIVPPLGRGNNMGAPRPPTSTVSSDWLGTGPSGTLGATPHVGNRGVTSPMALDGFGPGSSGPTTSLPPRPQSNPGLTPSAAPRPQVQNSLSTQTTAKDSKASTVTGNGFPSDSLFGGDAFSVIPKQSDKVTPAPSFSANSSSASSAMVPVTSMPQATPKQNSLDSLQNTFSRPPSGSQPQWAQSQNQQLPGQSTSTFSSGNQSGAGNTSAQSPPWPRMTQSDVQKYTKTFMEVDTDRDGKVTGVQARNLFLSWRLPREVLKQVWELSDQDNDSMLSLKEWCTALYLMERFREGRPLPAALPSSIMFDETLLPTTQQQTPAYGNAAWRPAPGLQQQPAMPGVRSTPAAGGRPPIQPPAYPQPDGFQSSQQRSRVPVLEKHLVNQLSSEEQSSLNSKFQEATEADKKVGELEKEILDSKEKIEFYRTKMQELVLYKSRCDNRLNEITERAIGDKKEAESLAKKYEEKYKQVGDIASKLTIEEATFRDIQERKMELYNAIVKMEQGGSADGILQVRADRIQSDLDELVKALSERCKKYGLKVKPAALVELPFGWQPGIQEGAADWDEDWDKFEDEGFTFVKELTVDVQNVVAPPKDKTKPVKKEKAHVEEDVPSSTTDGEKPFNTSEKDHEAHSDDELTKSPPRTPRSPAPRSTQESPTYENGDFAKKFDPDSLFHSDDHFDDKSVSEPTISGDQTFDNDHTWGTFDDTDSVWGMDPINTRAPDHGFEKDHGFGSNDFGVTPMGGTDSPQSNSFFDNRSPFTFDSVPSTPFGRGNSPKRDENSFFSRFDSFNTSAGEYSGFPQSEGGGAFSRFDSMRSTTNPQPSESSLARFDSMRSTTFDDGDLFGSSGPFKTSETPRRGSDNWSNF
ncbi:hypothetical protein ACHQM5_024317 [Ranunculus cassubicifolius]